MATLSNEDILAVAKAAQEVRMSWLAQTDFPSKDVVKESFRSAAEMLPDWNAGEPYELKVIRGVLIGISGGTDPRSGPFKAQAIQAAGQLHDYAVQLLVQLAS